MRFLNVVVVVIVVVNVVAVVIAARLWPMILQATVETGGGESEDAGLSFQLPDATKVQSRKRQRSIQLRDRTVS